jgi:transcriptional regulator with XRE-family HTH domain
MDREQHSSGTELGRYLRVRRTQVTPEEVGLPPSAGLRRTPGLRREELATLAGISIDYYTRLERGKGIHPSPSVVDSLARALRLEEAEHDYLRSLAAHTARTVPEPPTTPSRSVRPGVKLLLDR